MTRDKPFVAHGGLLAVAATVIIISACSRSATTTTKDPAEVMPCAVPAVELSLGRPIIDGTVAESL